MGAGPRFLISATLASLLAACAAPGPMPEATMVWDKRPESAETLYRARVEQLERDRGRIEYDIKAPVPGAKEPVVLPRATRAKIGSDAVETARAYAARMDSSSLLVWHGNSIVAEHYFDGKNANSLLTSKSLSKPISAIAVGRAIALGHIESLDQPVADFIIQWRGTDKQAMTIRDVLLMQSGLLEQSFDMDPQGPLMRAYVDPYHEQYLVENYPLTDRPGSRYSYSNATGDLVALIIEAATGKAYEVFLGEDVLAPIGAAGGETWLNRPQGKSHSGCCMFFRAQTYLKLARLLLDDGSARGDRILPAGYVAQMRKPSKHNQHYGLGVWLGAPYMERRGFLGPDSVVPGIYHSAPYLAQDVFLFDGSGSQVIYIVPSRDLIVMRTGENPRGGEVWDNSFLINTILGGIE